MPPYLTVELFLFAGVFVAEELRRLGGSGLAKCTGQADLTRCGCTNQEVYQVFTLTGVQRRRKRAVEGFGEGTRMRT